MKEMVGGCCVCSDDRGWAENPLVYCDGQGCTVAVHQACYGIVSVPSGNWYCRKCESPDRTKSGPNKQYCELCPGKDGAIKKTDNNGWAHVVCALYIPEVRFGNVTTMEPILLQHIPPERFNKACYICDESGKGTRSTVGACMNCNKSGCKQQFHVTCAQALGLLCEEAGNYLDNVKYCGYCQHHYSKLKKGANVKTVPAYRPLAADSPPSPDKETSDNWSKPGKRKLSTSSKGSSSTTPSGSKLTSGTTSPAPVAATSESAVLPIPEDPTSVPPPTTTAPAPTDTATPSSDPTVNGKFTTSNFVESVVTPSGSVFGDTGKSGKKRKSQAKEEGPLQIPAALNTSGNSGPPTEEKRLKIDSSAVSSKPETTTPSVVVKVPTTVPATSPTTTSPVSRQPTTTSPIAATSSIVVSVPLAVASLPTPPTTTVPAPAPAPLTGDDAPGKRGRSQSADKSDKGRKQKRGGSATGSKRGGRSSQATPPPPPPATAHHPLASPTPPAIATSVVTAPVAAPTPVVMPVSQAIKESPPSSPESKQKHKKQSQPRDDKDKLFQNGVNAPHMLGNQLNPASTMAQKMSDTLNQELEAHSIFTSEPNLSSQPGQLMGPQLHSRVIASVRGSGAGTPQSSSTPPSSSAWGASSSSSTPQTLDQLLERQWEQGSQFLMEQAQHFDIASLLTCLHQLRAENLRLEEHVSSLLQRRDHLLAVNARLAIPLVPPPGPPPNVNNIHPSAANVTVSMAMDGSRPVNVPQPQRVNNSYPGAPVENGPSSPSHSQSYHPGQPNPISRHHSPGSTSQSFVCSAPGVVVRSTTSNQEPRRSSSGSNSGHPQPGYPMYSMAASQQPQMVMRRDLPDHLHPSSKPS